MVQIRKPVKLSDDIIDRRMRPAAAPAIQRGRAAVEALRLKKIADAMILRRFDIRQD